MKYWVQQSARDNRQPQTVTIEAATPQAAIKSAFGVRVTEIENGASGEYITQGDEAGHRYWQVGELIDQ